MVSGTLALGVTDCLVEASQWAHMAAASRARFDPANTSLAGLALAPLAIGVAGVLVMSSEYGSGLILSTFAAVPRRSSCWPRRRRSSRPSRWSSAR